MLDTGKLHESSKFFYAAMSVLLSQHEESILPEILYLVSSDQMINIARTFGGRKIRIPTTRELSDALLTGLLAHYRTHENLRWTEIREKLDVDDKKFRGVRRQYDHWLEFLEKHKIRSPFEVLSE